MSRPSPRLRKDALTDVDRSVLGDIITLTEQIRRMRSGNRTETSSPDSVITSLRNTRETGVLMTGTTFSFCCVWPSREIGRYGLNPIAFIGTERRPTLPGHDGALTLSLRYGYHDYFNPGATASHLVRTWCYGPIAWREIWDSSRHYLVYQDFISFPTAVRRLKLEGSGVHIRASICAAEQIPCAFTYDDTPANSRYEGWSDDEWNLLNGRNLERGYRTPIFHDGFPMFCDICGSDLASQLYIVQGRLIGSGIIADMCVPCAARQGRGVGRGRGRLFTRHENGGWFCVAGFSFRPQEA